jgi:hypothetical protein
MNFYGSVDLKEKIYKDFTFIYLIPHYGLTLLLEAVVFMNLNPHFINKLPNKDELFQLKDIKCVSHKNAYKIIFSIAVTPYPQGPYFSQT